MNSALVTERLSRFEKLISWLLALAGDAERVEASEDQIVGFLKEESGKTKEGALEAWQDISPDFRKVIVRDSRTIQWNIFRNHVQISRLPTVEELEGVAELYERTTPDELTRKIRNLSGLEFERFLGAILSQHPEYRNITITQPARDGGIDIRGQYVAQNSLQFALIGQAKQVSAPISASIVRDFIGALDTCGEHRVMGLLVSTGGFTDPAVEALEKTRFPVLRWDMPDILREAAGIASRRIELSFSIPDRTFWDEIRG